MTKKRTSQSADLPEVVNLPKIGVDMMHYAKVLADASDETKYGKIKAFKNIVKIAVDADPKTEPFYADNKKVTSVTMISDTKAAIDCADVPPSILREWIGREKEDKIGVSVGEINAPDFGFCYRIKLAKGGYRYIRFYMGKFSASNHMNAETAKNEPNYQPANCIFDAAQRSADGAFYYMFDTDETNLTDEQICEKFFADFNWKPNKPASSEEQPEPSVEPSTEPSTEPEDEG